MEEKLSFPPVRQTAEIPQMYEFNFWFALHLLEALSSVFSHFIHHCAEIEMFYNEIDINYPQRMNLFFSLHHIKLLASATA